MNAKDFSELNTPVLAQMLANLETIPTLLFTELVNEKAALLIVDMINGFARFGKLHSDRITAIIPETVRLAASFRDAHLPVVSLNDHHPAYSPEFDAYPPHCIAGTAEAELVDELLALQGIYTIPKNSTNGFLEPAFQEWLQAHTQLRTFVVVGDCTDICIQQLAVTLKTWFNRLNISSRIIVPINAVATYDAGLHAGDLMHVVALHMMMDSGVELVSGIDFPTATK